MLLTGVLLLVGFGLTIALPILFLIWLLPATITWRICKHVAAVKCPNCGARNVLKN